MTLPPLWEHQKEGIRRAVAVDNFAWFFDPGCGKTRTFLEVLKDLTQRYGYLPSTMIFAPVIALENWKQEILKFTPIRETMIIVLSGPCKKRIHMVNEARIKFGGNFIAITNYEGVVANKDFFHALLDWTPQVIVLDESQKIKTYNSKRTKLVSQICDKAKHKYLLTGTPVTNSPMDIFSQYRALDGGKTFGRSFFIFRANYFYDKNHRIAKLDFPDFVIREGALEDMNRLYMSKQ